MSTRPESIAAVIALFEDHAEPAPVIPPDRKRPGGYSDARRYEYRPTKSGKRVIRGEVIYTRITVRCGHCRGLFEDMLGEMNPCPHCQRIVRGEG